MNRRILIGGAGFALAMLTLPGCALADDTPDYRYRLTVEVDTPEGVRSGSSVIEVDTRIVRPGSNPAGTGVELRAKGEAVAVDLGPRGVLFALLRSEDSSDWAGNVMFVIAPRSSRMGDEGFQDRFDAMLANREEQELPRTFKPGRYLPERPLYPMLVSFTDLTDPTSVAQVNPDDLAASFGEGVMLRRITAQLTDDPVTTGIEERLGWLDLYRALHFDGTSTVLEDMTTTNLSSHLSAGSFSTEFAQ